MRQKRFLAKEITPQTSVVFMIPSSGDLLLRYESKPTNEMKSTTQVVKLHFHTPVNFIWSLTNWCSIFCGTVVYKMFSTPPKA